MPPKKHEKANISVELRDGQAFDVATGDAISVTELNSHNRTKSYRIINAADNDLATGVHINQYEKTSIKFLQKLLDYAATPAHSIYNQMDICNKMFRWEDAVSTGLDILIDFTTSTFEFTDFDENSKVAGILDKLKTDLNQNSFYAPMGLGELIKSMAHEWFISGNVLPAEAWSNVDIGNGKAKIPTRIELLNPLHIKQDETAFMLGKQRMFFSLTSNATVDDVSSITNTFDEFRDIKSLAEDSDLITNNPIFTGNRIDGQNPAKKEVLLELDNQFVSLMKRKARHYEPWGMPYLTKAIQAVAYKQKLWQLDMNTIDGMINYITIFKIGSSDHRSPYHIVKRKRLTDFQSALRNPQGSTMIIWPHDIEVVTAGPKGEVLNFNEKYMEANRAIIQSLGVPPVLIDGTGNARAGWIAILAMVERLEKVREAIKNYIQFMLIKIGIENNLEEEFSKVKFRWHSINLQDEATVKNLLLAFYDRGLLPIQTAHHEAGYPHEDLKEIKLVEEKEKMDELFARPDIPFASNPGQHTQNDGRPRDNVDTEDKPNVTGSMAFAVTMDLVAQKFESDLIAEVDGLEMTIDSMKKKTQAEVSNQVLISFVRMATYAEVVTNSQLDDPNDIIFAPKVRIFNEQSVNKIKDFAENKLTKLVIRKNSEDRELMMAGILSKVRTRVKMFAAESVRNINLANTLLAKQKDGFVGALLNTPSDTQCSFCKEMNGEYMSLIEIMDNLPFHPHQRFTLNFQKEDLVAAGKKKKKPIRQNTTKKSKSY